MELPRRIPYNPRWGTILLCSVFFGACAAFMAHLAAHNSIGLIINGIITLGPSGATAFYWIVSALNAGFVLMGLMLLMRRVTNPKVLELAADSLLLPYGRFQTQSARIAYAEIQSISELEVSGQTYLYITAGGLKYTLIEALFPNKKTYFAVRDFLISQTSGGR